MSVFLEVESPLQSDTAYREEMSFFSRTRESMEALPRFLQPLLTLITGKCSSLERPTRWTALDHLVTTLATLLAGWAAILAFKSSLVSLFGVLLATSAMRKLQIVIIHHCSHSNFFARGSRWNRYLGNTLSFLLLIEPFEYYRRRHILDHHFRNHMTLDDPTVQFLFDQVGLEPEMSVREAKLRMLLCFLSPDFYLRGLAQRIRVQCEMRIPGRIALALLWISALIAVHHFHAWKPFLLMIVIPLFILYPVSSALRLAVEHTFSPKQNNRDFDLQSLARLSNAVYCGEVFPQRSGSSWLRHHAKVARWFLRMTFIHLPIRVFVLVGDTPIHDHHHRHPLYRDWPNYAFARTQAYKTEFFHESPYREVWGYFEALNHSLKSLEQSKGWYVGL